MLDTKILRSDVSNKRKLKNISLDVACKEIGIAKPTLSRIENGKMPDANTLLKLCKWLEKNPMDYYS